MLSTTVHIMFLIGLSFGNKVGKYYHGHHEVVCQRHEELHREVGVENGFGEYQERNQYHRSRRGEVLEAVELVSVNIDSFVHVAVELLHIPDACQKRPRGEDSGYEVDYYFGIHLSIALSNKIGSFFSAISMILSAKNPATPIIPYLYFISSGINSPAMLAIKKERKAFIRKRLPRNLSPLEMRYR